MRVSFGGSIGSGKSTVLNMLKQDGYNVFFEPIDEWNHLSKFYENKKRWSFTFQIEVLNSFVQCPNDGYVLCERSPWESYHIFTKMLVENGDMSVDELELFNKLYENIAWKPDLFIYLRTTPEVCMERIIKRNRACESSIDVPYLRSIHDLYDKMYERNHIIVDANRSMSEVYDDVSQVLAEHRPTYP